MLKRDLYLQRIRPFYDSELIKVITGVRRCGKSVLLMQIQQELIELGIPQKRIVLLNFEDYRNRDLLEGEHLHQHIEQLFDSPGKRYILCDEIQNVKDFELVINSIRSTHDASIFLTGSNSRLLSGALASHLGGRTISLTMMPFTFQEFCTFKGVESGAQSLNEYKTWGGFPLVCSVETEEMKYAVLSNLYDSIVLKDIVLRNKITSAHMLERVLEYLIGSSSLTISGNTIAGSLKTANIPISAPTVYDYIKFCTEACILSKVERYDIRGKRALSFEEKIYVADLGFFQLKKNRVKEEFSLITETLIYNELIARGYRVYIGKTQKGEIDFIAQNQKEKCYIQVAYRLDSQQTIDREYGAFDSIHDHYPKYVISADEWTMGVQNGIVHIPLLKFLTTALH